MREREYGGKGEEQWVVEVCIKRGANQDPHKWRRKEKMLLKLTYNKIHISTRNAVIPAEVLVHRKICAKKGRFESCVAHRKCKRFEVCMKERVSCDACKVPGHEGGSRAAREGGEGGGRRDDGEGRGAVVQIVCIDRRQNTLARPASKE